MKRLTSIVATNAAGVIGQRDAVPWRLRADLRFFREATLGHVVVMGRRTFDTLDRRPLPGRTNIVLSHELDLGRGDATCLSVTSVDEALFEADRAAGSRREAFVIGGAAIYEQFARLVDRYLVTMVEKDVPHGDTFLSPDLFGDEAEWEMALLRRQEADADNEAAFSIFEMTSARAASIRAGRDHRIARARAAMAPRNPLSRLRLAQRHSVFL